MGREKEYRQRLKYQVRSVEKKTLASQLAAQLSGEVGMSRMESKILSRRLAQWLVVQEGFHGANQIVVEARRGRESFRRNHKGQLKPVKITPYDEQDLQVEYEFGLKVMQAGRIVRMVEEAYGQDALLSLKQMVLLTNITPTSLRNRLRAYRTQGMYLPYAGLSKKERARQSELRSTWTLRRYLQGEAVVEVRRQAAMSKAHFEELLLSFSRLVMDSACDSCGSEREMQEWTGLIEEQKACELKRMLPSISEAIRKEGEGDLEYELRSEYGLTPVAIRAVMQIVRELGEKLGQQRPANTVVYWTVSAGEPAGKPLDECELVPVSLSLIEEKEDVPDCSEDADFNCVSKMKVSKAMRYASEAKSEGGYLTFADLGYLLGIHPEAISRLVRTEAGKVIPLRGSECDIGRGMTHRKEIIGLFMELYTETQISDRTGHSYEAIENYVKEFGTVLLLAEEGLSVPLIRKVTGRSRRLIEAYLELMDEYKKPEYAFRLNYLRRLVTSGPEGLKKGGLQR